MNNSTHINFCHISPTPHLPQLIGDKYNTQLLLAHLIEGDEAYVEFYRQFRGVKIMDNSAFEMYKQGRPMYPSEKLIEMGNRVGADYIVLSDYPGEPSSTTIDAAKTLIPQFRRAGFKTFFVPQSRVGDLDDYLECWRWAVNNEEIDLIGFSILGAPNAFGVESNNKLQRFLSRWKIFQLLEEKGILDRNNPKHINKIHCLGMVDGPNEVQLLGEYSCYIYSWDSSAAVWAGLNEIQFDHYPTGLVGGKFEREVDFGFNSSTFIDVALSNMQYLDRLCNQHV